MSPISQKLTQLQVFCQLTQGKISNSSNFQIMKSHPIFEISTRNFSCVPNFDRGLTSKQQQGVSDISFRDFLGGGAERPPRPNQALQNVGPERVNKAVLGQKFTIHILKYIVNNFSHTSKIRKYVNQLEKYTIIQYSDQTTNMRIIFITLLVINCRYFAG